MVLEQVSKLMTVRAISERVHKGLRRSGSSRGSQTTDTGMGHFPRHCWKDWMAAVVTAVDYRQLLVVDLGRIVAAVVVVVVAAVPVQ